MTSAKVLKPGSTFMRSLRAHVRVQSLSKILDTKESSSSLFSSRRPFLRMTFNAFGRSFIGNYSNFIPWNAFCEDIFPSVRPKVERDFWDSPYD